MLSPLIRRGKRRVRNREGDYGVVSFQGNRESTGKERAMASRYGRSTEKIVIDNRRVLFLLVTRAESRTSALSIAIASRKRVIFPPNPSSQARSVSDFSPVSKWIDNCFKIWLISIIEYRYSSRERSGGTKCGEKSCYVYVQEDSEICIDIYLLKDVNTLKE